MKMVDVHFVAAFSACDAMAHLSDLLPKTDLVLELQELIYTQHDLFIHMLEGRHYGSDALDEFCTYALMLSDEARRLRDEED